MSQSFPPQPGFHQTPPVAREELDGEAQSVTEQLRLLYMQLETGRITEAEFSAREKEVLDRLDRLQEQPSDAEEESLT